MSIKNTLHILVAPLDWGLGHTTRCMPVIQHLLHSGHRVLFAGNEQQRGYVLATLPQLPIVHLNGYNISYAKQGNMFMAAIAGQVPKVMRAIGQEHEWLKKIVAEHSIDAVISDNRYGLHHAAIPCAIMTHQLQVMSGMGAWVDNMLRKLHYHYLQKFNTCWVVDVPDAPGLAGALSHPATLPHNATYVGLLSQIPISNNVSKDYLLVLLSGPEPQRTLLSRQLWAQLQSYKGQVVFAEGKADADAPAHIPAHIRHYPILTKDNLETILQGAAMVICRSGYSTIMDLVKLQKKAILIPTPGQTEQEYLAKQLQQQGIYPYLSQTDFEINKAMAIAAQFPYQPLGTTAAYEMHMRVLDNWLQNL